MAPDPDPYLWQMDPDPDPWGKKTHVDPDPEHCFFPFDWPQAWQTVWIHLQLSNLHFAASYAPETGGVLKRGNPGCRKKKFIVVKWFFAVLLNFFRPTAPNCDVECIPLNLRTTEEAHMIGLLCVFLFLHNVSLKLMKTWKKEFEKSTEMGTLGVHTIGGYKEMSSAGWPIAPLYMSPNAGRRSGGRLRGLSLWAQLYTGVQISFGDWDVHVSILLLREFSPGSYERVLNAAMHVDTFSVTGLQNPT